MNGDGHSASRVYILYNYELTDFMFCNTCILNVCFLLHTKTQPNLPNLHKAIKKNLNPIDKNLKFRHNVYKNKS